MVEPGWVDHDQSKDNADWIENLEKDRVATESHEETVFNKIDLLNPTDNENYKFEYTKKFNVNLDEEVSISRNG